MSRLQQLRERAEAATPGPWYYDGRDIFTTSDSGNGRFLVIPLPETWHASQAVSREDAEHVAAFAPDSALMLLDTIDRLVELVDELKPTGAGDGWDRRWENWWHHKKSEALALVQEQRV